LGFFGGQKRGRSRADQRFWGGGGTPGGGKKKTPGGPHPISEFCGPPFFSGGVLPQLDPPQKKNLLAGTPRAFPRRGGGGGPKRGGKKNPQNCFFFQKKGPSDPRFFFQPGNFFFFFFRGPFLLFEKKKKRPPARGGGRPNRGGPFFFFFPPGEFWLWPKKTGGKQRARLFSVPPNQKTKKKKPVFFLGPPGLGLSGAKKIVFFLFFLFPPFFPFFLSVFLLFVGGERIFFFLGGPGKKTKKGPGPKFWLGFCKGKPAWAFFFFFAGGGVWGPKGGGPIREKKKKGGPGFFWGGGPGGRGFLVNFFFFFFFFFPSHGRGGGGGGEKKIVFFPGGGFFWIFGFEGLTPQVGGVPWPPAGGRGGFFGFSRPQGLGFFSKVGGVFNRPPEGGPIFFQGERKKNGLARFGPGVFFPKPPVWSQKKGPPFFFLPPGGFGFSLFPKKKKKKKPPPGLKKGAPGILLKAPAPRLGKPKKIKRGLWGGGPPWEFCFFFDLLSRGGNQKTGKKKPPFWAPPFGNFETGGDFFWAGGKKKPVGGRVYFGGRGGQPFGPKGGRGGGSKFGNRKLKNGTFSVFLFGGGGGGPPKTPKGLLGFLFF